MSYLNTPRLTFSGQFQADPSTVNNDPTHFNNDTFQSEYQNYQTADAPNGWWNPDGTGNWRFIGCKITSVTYLDGTSTDNPLLDPIIGMSIMDTDSRTAAKIVDLDSQQQMVSELWGLIVRIVSNEGNTLLKGEYEVAAFSNIWFSRSIDKTRDSAAAATYQSIIKNINWNFGISNSRYLNELKTTSSDQLSIQFTLDRYNGNNTSPQFTLGRIAGSIGPALANEPKHFVLGRQLFPSGNVTNCNYATALVDEKLKQVVLDFGNALQFKTGGLVNETRDLHLVINTSSPTSPSYVAIGKIKYSDLNWYMGTSGICTFTLNDEQLSLVSQYPLGITQSSSATIDVFTLPTDTITFVYNECSEYVCADKFVFRLNPDQEMPEPFVVNFYATSLGQPLPNATIALFQTGINDNGYPPSIPNPPTTPDQILLLPPYSFSNLAPSPINGSPTTALDISSDQSSPTTTATTDDNGFVSITIPYNDPGFVREFQYYALNSDQTEYQLTNYDPSQFMDGQYYSVNYCLDSQITNFPNNINPSNSLSVLVFNGPKTLSEIEPDWENFIKPIMKQYANLYPLMSKGIFNLADKKVFKDNAQILKLVFGKDPYDPNYMPATRDLSAYKRTVILNYLQDIIDQQEEIVEENIANKSI
ncbi:hypothetical protein FNW52_07865 [Flavobacterium sp. ZT3R18]|uniref:hypothetical protein n=1 Tax=Flavobacterium sp. ZT3R18 TaxID=2594429 RepID=UPI00117AD2F3|nr:hypothetical protein [Flavobacterium sp. ZT3R18]TRX36516.1 hypothetical protein FNW52_07865 [Flavobacterium sp. ZT3R18]